MSTKLLFALSLSPQRCWLLPSSPPPPLLTILSALLLARLPPLSALLHFVTCCHSFHFISFRFIPFRFVTQRWVCAGDCSLPVFVTVMLCVCVSGCARECVWGASVCVCVCSHMRRSTGHTLLPEPVGCIAQSTSSSTSVKELPDIPISKLRQPL